MTVCRTLADIEAAGEHSTTSKTWQGSSHAPRAVWSPCPKASWPARMAALHSPTLVHGRLASCNTVCVAQVVHVPYVVEQDEDGAWHASALFRLGVGASGDGATREEAITDLRAALLAERGFTAGLKFWAHDAD